MKQIARDTSAFFSPGENPEDSFEPVISLMYRSEDGPFELYECAERGRITVLKAIRQKDRDNPLYIGMLRKEYEIGRRLNHPNIREYHSMRDFPGLGICIEMEWIDARTLEELMEQCRCDRRFCDGIVSQILDAVRILHMKQVVHRDLKPSNILVTRKGDNVKIIDFSLSDSDSSLILKGNAGTLMYASPEQINCKEADYRSDIYSLGVILSQMSSGRRYRKVARKCMDSNPRERYSNVAEIKEELFRPSRTPWYAAAITALIIVLSAFAIFHNPEPQNVTTEGSGDVVLNEEQSIPDFGKKMPEGTDDTGSKSMGESSAPARKHKEKELDAQDIDNIFQEATKLFEGI